MKRTADEQRWLAEGRIDEAGLQDLDRVLRKREAVLGRDPDEGATRAALLRVFSPMCDIPQ